MITLLSTLALAGSPEIDALASAVQRGLPPDVTVSTLESLPPLTSEDVVELLRAGAAVITLQDATGGLHPTTAEQRQAQALGSLPIVRRTALAHDPNKEYSNLDWGAWVRLSGVDLVLTLWPDGSRTGKLLSVAGDKLLLSAGGGSTRSLTTSQVRSVRRVDGQYIETRTEVEAEDEEGETSNFAEHVSHRDREDWTRLKNSGSTMMGIGAASMGVGLVSLLIYNANLNAVATGDLTKVNSAVYAGEFAALTGLSGAAVFIGGEVTFHIGRRKLGEGAAARYPQ